MFWRRKPEPLRSAPEPAAMPGRAWPPRILVACDRFVMRGGLLRFERFGRSVRLFGGEMAWLQLGEGGDPAWRSDFPALSFDAAAAARWDATMVPGAGFPDRTVRAFSRLRAPQFGVRVQHVLNDPTRLDGFVKVNRAFEPDLVVFNNRHFDAGQAARLPAPRQAVLEGAVDLDAFAPAPFKRAPAAQQAPMIGGLANKNFASVVEALALLPGHVRARAIGTASDELRALADARAPGRVVFDGVVPESALPDFLRAVDVVAHVETTAGWANIVAEALASGAPVVATRAGTLSLVESDVTGLSLDAPTPAAIAAAVGRLLAEPDLAPRLAAAGRAHVLRFGWTTYARAMLDLCLGPREATA